jgi:hypothetical protein
MDLVATRRPVRKQSPYIGLIVNVPPPYAASQLCLGLCAKDWQSSCNVALKQSIRLLEQVASASHDRLNVGTCVFFSHTVPSRCQSRLNVGAVVSRKCSISCMLRQQYHQYCGLGGPAIARPNGYGIASTEFRPVALWTLLSD